MSARESRWFGITFTYWGRRWHHPNTEPNSWVRSKQSISCPILSCSMLCTGTSSILIYLSHLSQRLSPICHVLLTCLHLLNRLILVSFQLWSVCLQNHWIISWYYGTLLANNSFVGKAVGSECPVTQDYFPPLPFQSAEMSNCFFNLSWEWPRSM